MTSLFSLFLKGTVIGISVAATPGPVGILCLRRTLTDGMYIGILSGLGAAVADAIFAFIADLGVTSISNFLIIHHVAFNIIGGIFLAYLGIKIYLAVPVINATPIQGKGMFGAFALTFFLTVTNPITILYFAAIVAGSGIISASNDCMASIALVGGVFFGSTVWFTLMCCAAVFLRSRINAAALQMINKLSGILIIGFAVYIFLRAFSR